MKILKHIQKQHLIIFLPLFLLSILISFVWKGHNTFQYGIQCQTKETTKKIMESNISNFSISVQNAEKELLVLIWVWPFGENFPLDRCQKQYNISGCKFTANRSLYDTADALIIHHFDIMYNKKSLPQKPRPHFQRWVWFNLEPPLIIRNLHFLDNLINLTMTFRKDSDIYIPYGHVEILKEPRSFNIPPKSKLVSWVVSKWYPGIPRTAYYEELKKYIQIDVYGRQNKQLRREDFHKTISQYKFYLAFENSVYKDYITEKLWSNAFDSWTVPVVLGTSRKNYELYIPGDSFIHVDDFSSQKELADYLLELDKDDEKYRKYFNWRSFYQTRFDTGWPLYYCQGCRGIIQATEYQVIPSIENWFLEKS
ncbi:4-galactosyl-N-acetylglucosaminide 3-alpha-L-fucosyltransferase 9-like [Bombina bombina]|uniref:4-galactosyl-N-acetylglucosaminide 3-alpha-L-fucosyltransferase 9-like n=1 Tax=Bombina bombina TaxID=8345 RepID=UPI00235B02D8|nr:4-galactosyl-N-acetylglucosaminide 3-alpha-L-fucosyltransferase 9-like [Bombina bombina]